MNRTNQGEKNRRLLSFLNLISSFIAPLEQLEAKCLAQGEGGESVPHSLR